MTFDQYAYTKYNREIENMQESVREEILEVQDQISEDPFDGKPLKGSLKGWRTYPFSHGGNSYRIAYKIDEEENRVIFASVGRREGFYEDLKRFT